MGTLNITELAHLPVIDGNVVPMVSHQRIDGKTYTSTTSSAPADTPETETRFLRVAVIEAHFVNTHSATADGNSILLPAGSVEYFEATTLTFRSVA